MALTIVLRPFEKLLVGKAVITNGSSRSKITISGTASILKEADLLSEDDANTPCRRIYLAVQDMLLDPNNELREHHYFAKIIEAQFEIPSSIPFIVEMNLHLVKGQIFQALKVARKLIDHESNSIGGDHMPFQRSFMRGHKRDDTAFHGE